VSNHSIILDNEGRGCKNFRAQEWLHLALSMITIIGYLAFAGFLMVKYGSGSDHYVFSSLIIIKSCFCLYFLFNGVLKELPFQVLMQIFTMLSMWSLDLIYYINDISHPPENSEVEEMGQVGLELMLYYLRSVLSLLNLLTGCITAWRYWTIEQAVFKTVGTDLRRVSVFRNLFFGFSLMIFDMETSLVSLMLFLRNGFSPILTHEIAVLSAGGAFLLLWLWLGYKAIRGENRILTSAFILISCVQPAYFIVLFIRNIKFTGSSEPLLIASSHYMSLLGLMVHLSVIAAVIVASHYFGRGYGDALVNGVHVSVKHSTEYEELRRTLFHPSRRSHRSNNDSDPCCSRTILLNAEVY